MKARDLSSGAHVPAKVVTIPRSAFADDYRDKPVDDAKIGLRLMSDADLDSARDQALEHARKMPHDALDSRAEAFADKLVMLACARATTMPHDAHERYFGKMADITVCEALTVDGARRLYEEILLFQTEQSPLLPEATDEQIAAIAAGLEKMPAGKAARLRRVLGYVVEQTGQA